MTWHPDGDPYYHQSAPDRPVVIPEAEVIRMYREIMEAKQSPIDRRIAMDNLARVMDPVAWERRQRDMAALRSETMVACHACGADVPWDTTARPTDGPNTKCPKCGAELGVDVDPGMYEPSRLGETVPKT